jgi:hypothetical protein
MTSHEHCSIAYTIRKASDGTFIAAFRDRNGCFVTVSHKLRRVAVACIKGHIEDD